MTTYRSASTLHTPRGDLRVHRLDAVPGFEVLPFSHKIVLENLLRHRSTDPGGAVTDADIDALVSGTPRPHDIAFHPSRVFLHDTNGVPVLTDLAALRDAVAEAGGDPAAVDTVIPAELTVDHSVVTDHFARPDAPELNVRLEYQRNAERYRFLKWGEQAFDGLRVVPPGAGIMHQINVEHLAQVVTVRDGAAFPDTVAGTDSHTTMVNGLSVLAWGVGGIEAEAALLGQPISMLIPPVVGVELTGSLPPGVTATDLVLTLTERMRALGVVGQFVEFFGHGVAQVSVATRCTIANMSPEFGSTAAIFPIDEATCDFLRLTGREEDHVALVEQYAKEQGLWHDPDARLRYDRVLQVDLSEVTPSLAGPRRPQDRLDLAQMPPAVAAAVAAAVDAAGTAAGGAAETPTGPGQPGRGDDDFTHGAVAIASLTSCTNTSNPAVMVAAGLVARNAVQRGLTVPPWVKTSLAPGSRVVTDYLTRSGLIEPLEALGFGLVGYGCMTCIGNSGNLLPQVERRVREDGLVVASVLSGNRNFDGRINNDVTMNFLASPPLVIAYALAGTTDIDLSSQPLGHDPHGELVLLADLWPDEAEIARIAGTSIEPEMYRTVYDTIFDGDENWRALPAPTGARFSWDPESTYLQRPPFFDAATPSLGPLRDLVGMRALEVLGDSVTTDHICPAGRIPTGSAAGRFLAERGVAPADFNSYASRRGNWQVMRRGGFTNQRLHNRLAPHAPGGFTADLSRPLAPGAEPTVGEVSTVADHHAEQHTPLLVIGGREYGTGSSRDWAAKVTALLGVRVVLAESFERIHRSNLVGMGVLPLQFAEGESATSWALDGTEVYEVRGLAGQDVAPEWVEVYATHPQTGTVTQLRARARLDTPREQTYFRAGGLLPHVLAETLQRTAHHSPETGHPRNEDHA